MKKFENEMSIIVLITFSLTMILIFVGVFMNFFSKDSEEIIIALIGVSGAILGGIISGGMTLMGVKRTIEQSERKDFKKERPKKLAFAIRIINEFSGIIEYIKSDLSKSSQIINGVVLYDDHEHHLAMEGLNKYINKIDDFINSKELDDQFIIIGAELYLGFDELRIELKKLHSQIGWCTITEEFIEDNIVYSYEELSIDNFKIATILIESELELIKNFKERIINEKEKI